MEALSRFYGVELLSKQTVNIHLLACSKQASKFGGTFISKKNISLEIQSLKNINDYLLIIIHEIGHSFIKKEHDKKIRKIVKQFNLPKNKLFGRKTVDLINELILCSLVPDGYLGQKHLGVVPEKISRPAYKQLSSFKKWKLLEAGVVSLLYPLAKDYVENKKSLDENYINKTVDTTIRTLKFLKD